MILESETGTIEIKILNRTDTETTDYWDGNWLHSAIKINVRGFSAIYNANLRVDDLQRFYANLLSIKNDCIKEAKFTTMEEGIYLDLKIEPKGSLTCIGRANDENGNSLKFKIESDQASLNHFTEKVRTTLELYPLIGGVGD